MSCIYQNKSKNNNKKKLAVVAITAKKQKQFRTMEDEGKERDRNGET